MPKYELTHERLLDAISYNQITGEFIKKNHRLQTYEPTGSIDPRGYIIISVCGNKESAHRLAIFYVTGKWPSEVDHINHYRWDNRWDNLRLVSHTENGRNQKRMKNNTSGVTGVYFWASRNKWRAFIKTDVKNTHLGVFSNFFDAVCARKAAEVIHGYHKNHGK